MFKPRVIDIPLYQDDRGYVYCAMDYMHDKGIVRTYVVENHSKGMIRCWHGHREADTYLHVISGSAKVAAMKMEKCDISQDVIVGETTTSVLTARKPQLFEIPFGYYNGTMSLEDNTKILVYSTLSFDEVKDDDERACWTINQDIWKVENR